jgi:sulfur carrier protein ThiS adenylyltransferase
MTQLRLTSPPVLYAYLHDEALTELSARAFITEDEGVVLPDDLPISYVIQKMRDSRLPVYFQTLDISDAKLFELRTQRFRQMGYDIARLQKSTVLIGGVGLLGTEIATNLATVGVGHIVAVDNGSVDWLNIYRQTMFSRQDVYLPKTDVLKKHLEDMGGVRVEAIALEVPSWTSSLSSSRIREHINKLDNALSSCDLVVGTFDRFSPRALLQSLCLVRHRPFLTAALEPALGQIVLFDGRKDGCYCCGMPNPQEGRWYDGGACTLATLESQRIVGALATKLAISKLEGKDNPHNELIYHVQSATVDSHSRSGTPRCSLCGPTGLAREDPEDAIPRIIDWLYHGGS